MISTGLVLDTGPLGELTDRSRNHHTLTNHNAVPVRGKYGKGMKFNGTDAYIDCGNDSSLDITDAITLEAWVKPNEHAHASIVSKDTAGESYWAAIKTDGGDEMVYFYLEGVKSYVGDCGIINDVWQQITYVYDKDGGANNFKVYRNGVVKYQSTETGSIGSTETNLYIGISGIIKYHFNGEIASVRIYNRALSADEIEDAYMSRGYTGGREKSEVLI